MKLRFVTRRFFEACPEIGSVIAEYFRFAQGTFYCGNQEKEGSAAI